MLKWKKSARALGAVLAMFAGICAAPAFAECSGEYCSDVYVDQLYIETSGGIWVKTSGTETALSCTPDSGVFLRLAFGSDGLKNIYAALLTAQASGRKVHIRIVGGSAPCAIAYVQMDRE